MSAGWFATGAALAGLGVGLGAFGAHGLKSRASPEMVAVWETGVRYHLVHALGLLAVAWAIERWPAAHLSGWLFVAGTVIFSGSLYVLVLTGQRWLGAITPLGGLAFIAGWLLLAWTALRAG
jgi:uncharacterized membrane protein YgdD (TMEM256/DUF423 family)